MVLLRQMREMSVMRNVISFFAAISACEDVSLWVQALALLRELWEACVMRNVISFSAAISACEKGSQWQQAVPCLGRCGRQA